MTSFRWGVFGTGAITAKFVSGLAAAPGHKAVMVASRSQDSADRFAAGMGIEHAFAGYAEAAKAAGESGLVDGVYIASPPSQHTEHALMCIEAGLPVLVEKPFAANADDARKIAEAARAAGVFAMEAMWTRFLPAAQAFKQQIASGAVGEVRLVSGSFGSSKLPDAADSAFDPARGGGAIGNGVYPLSVAQWLFGTPTDIKASGRIGDTGVEEDAVIQLIYPGGVLASFICSIRAWAPNDFRVMGTDGAAAFAGPIYRPFGVELSQQSPKGKAPASFGWKNKLRESGLAQGVAQRINVSSRSGGKMTRHPFAGNGYHYEALEVAACIARGETESAIMPLDDSIAVARTVDNVRAAIGLPPHASS